MTFQQILIAFGAILLVSSVFSMFGKGGGSLYTPVLVMLGVSVSSAISTSLVLNLITALVATIVFAKNKLVDYRFCLSFIPGTVLGSILGAFLSNKAPKELLLWIFSGFLFIAGFLMISSVKSREKDMPKLNLFMLLIVVFFSFGVGVLSSLIGVGGGLIIFPFLILFLNYPAQKAAGANSLIVAVSSAVGSLGHLAFGEIEFRLLLFTALACIIGSYIGSNVTVKASPKFVKVAFAGIMWFFAIQISLDLLGIKII
ncbi:MAG: sulfite exporter TauE/SafE family protein [Acidobacteriota bacterium]|nr:sulfite exporter TauE/SafE family protein [Thermoanaerobaculaceae bacterium]